jgi:hypothetical protein
MKNDTPSTSDGEIYLPFSHLNTRYRFVRPLRFVPLKGTFAYSILKAPLGDLGALLYGTKLEIQPQPSGLKGCDIFCKLNEALRTCKFFVVLFYIFQSFTRCI